MIQRSIHQEAIITVNNIHAPNIRAPKNRKQTLTGLKGEKDSNTVIIGESDSPLSITDSTSTVKVSKKTEDLSGTADEMDRRVQAYTFCPAAAGCTSRACVELSP